MENVKIRAHDTDRGWTCQLSTRPERKFGD